MAKKSSFFVTLSILSTYLMVGVMGLINPAIRSIQEAFPNVPYTTITLLSTLPSLLVLPSILISGRIAGIKIKFKPLATIGLLFIIIGGSLPYITRTNFTLILIERALFGIGLGTMYPLGNAIILRLFEGEQKANLLGLGVLVKNLGGIIFQFLGGLLAAISWYMVFTAHIIGILPLIIILLLLPEPEKPVASDSKKAKIKLPATVWACSIAFALVTLLIYPFFLNISSYLKLTGLGNAAIAGTTLSLYTIGGMLGGLAFGKLFKFLKRFVIAFQLFCMAIGLVSILFGNNIIFVFIGAAMMGIGFASMQPTLFMIIGMVVDSAGVGFSASLVLAISNFAIFLSSYWIALISKLTHNAIVGPLYLAMIVFGIFAFLFIIINPFPKTKDESAK